MTKDSKKRIVFHVGGPAFHPVAEQAALISNWLGDANDCRILESLSAFESLDDCDLLVLMGLFWTGMKPNTEGRSVHQPMQPRHREAFESYIVSGRPLLAHHGSVASYDDWPRFGELAGVTWVWGTTKHSPIDNHKVRVLGTGHPVIKGIADYTITDELYYDLKLTPGLNMAVHAEADWNGRSQPMVLTAEGGRAPGAGKLAYLANGHDMRAFECPAMKQLWCNTVEWLTGS